jgi:hypothetical protein
VLAALRADFARIPELLQLPMPEQPRPEPVLDPGEVPALDAAVELSAALPAEALAIDQLGLF